MVGAPDCHDVCVVVDQGIINVVGSKSVHDHGHVAVGPKESHGLCNAHVVMQEAGKEDMCLVGTQVILSHPVWVVLGKPEEVVAT